MESLLISDSSGQPYNINAVNISTGQSISSFKGGKSTPGTLCTITDDYVISALPNKPVLNVYEMNRRSQQTRKVVTPGVVKALCTSADGFYIAAGIQEKVLLWNISSGELLVVLSRHYQDVTCLCFTNDSSFLVSSGLDGIVSLWSVAEVVDIRIRGDVKEPKYCWSSHSLPVTCVRCSAIGGFMSRLFTSSLDRTVKIHDIALGTTLLTLVFNSGIMSLCLDYAETMLIAGGYDGSISKVDLFTVANKASDSENKTVNIDVIEESSEDCNMLYKGHTKTVTCLACCIDGSMFVSGSADQTVRIWDVASGQNLRIMNVKGPVTNLLLLLTPASLSSIDYKPPLPFPKLARAVLDDDIGERPKKLYRLDHCLQSKCNEVKPTKEQLLVEACMSAKARGEGTMKVHDLKKDVGKLKVENEKLYQFAIDKLLPNYRY